MSSSGRKLLRYLGYPAFFGFCFFVFAYFTFPYDRLRDYLVQEIEYRRGPGDRREPTGYTVSIVELSPYWLSGVELSGVRIERAATDPTKPPVDMTIPNVTARVQLLSLFLRKVRVAFDAEVGGGGTAEGTYETSFDGEDRALDVTLDGLVLARLGPIREEIGVPVRGVVSGTIDLHLPQKAAESNGAIDLRIADFIVGDVGAKIPLPSMPSGLTIDPIHAGPLEFTMSVVNGVGTIQKFQGQGRDLDVAAEGTVHLASPLRMSRVDVLVRMRAKDSYRTKSPRTEALFSLLEMNPVLQSAKSPDGAYQVHLRGSPSTRVMPVPAGDERFGRRH